MAAGDGSSDAENGVKMAARDRFHGPGPGAAAGTGAGADGADGEQGSQAGTAGASAPEAQEAGGGSRQPRPGEPAGAAGGSDAAGARDPDQPAPAGGEGLEVYGDSAYGSGEARAAYRDAGHDTVIKPKPLQPAVPGGFTLDLSGVPQGPSVTSASVGSGRLLVRRRVVAWGPTITSATSATLVPWLCSRSCSRELGRGP